MNLVRFSIYTTIGALIWITILAWFGYYVGVWFGDDLSISNLLEMLSSKADSSVLKDKLHYIVLGTLGFVVVIAIIYVLIYKAKHKKRNNKA